MTGVQTCALPISSWFAAANQLVIEGSPVAQAIMRLMAKRSNWEGTATQLLAVLSRQFDRFHDPGTEWPKNAVTLSKKIALVSANLRREGITIQKARDWKHRRMRIEKNEKSGPEPVHHHRS